MSESTSLVSGPIPSRHLHSEAVPYLVEPREEAVMRASDLLHAQARMQEYIELGGRERAMQVWNTNRFCTTAT